ncbi:hypothetical protein [Nostoc sp.]
MEENVGFPSINQTYNISDRTEVLGCRYYGSLEKNRYIGFASTLEGLILS